jgi:hypothetical protein
VLFADKCGATSTAPKPTAKPTPKPTRRPTATARPKATPRPTPKPVKATAAPTPVIELAPTAVPTPPLDGDDLLPSDDPGTEPSDAPEVSQPTDDPSDGFDGAVGMRVQDRTTTDGLLSTIVGGVTGYFFGG